MLFGILGLVGVLVLFPLLVSLFFRRVVPTNEVHIVQYAKKTVSYGKDTGNGNTYLEWPSWVPFIGVERATLPVSVFDLNLFNYEAYDKGRLPFVIDVTAFFRITDSNIAAQRVSSFKELQEQLVAIVQGAARSILAGSEIESIMQGRSEFGDKFTEEVGSQLQAWGVETVKNIELMDIRDSEGSRVIHNIMEKKKSHIEMESRSEVAKNNKLASLEEINAKQEVDVQNQLAFRAVGLEQAEAEKQVEIAKQEALQAVREEQRVTKEKDMAIVEVERVRNAEILKQAEIVEADKEKQKQVLHAEGHLESEKLAATAIQAKGDAEAAAKKAMELAPVQAQIVLAKEIGENKGYQNYLVAIKQLEVAQEVGVEQAEALSNADVKIINSSNDPQGGLSNVMDLFSPNGGTKVGAMLEGFKNTPAGESILKALNGSEEEELGESA